MSDTIPMPRHEHLFNPPVKFAGMPVNTSSCVRCGCSLMRVLESESGTSIVRPGFEGAIRFTSFQFHPFMGRA